MVGLKQKWINVLNKFSEQDDVLKRLLTNFIINLNESEINEKI